MNNDYYEKWSDMVKKAQEPLQAMAELNVKTVQNLSYIKPEELAKIKKPEELLEKQVALAIENGQKALEYMQKSFEIFEKTVKQVVSEAKKKTDEAKK